MLQHAALGKHQSPPHPFTLNRYAGSFFGTGLDGFGESRGNVFWAILCFWGFFSALRGVESMILKTLPIN